MPSDLITLLYHHAENHPARMALSDDTQQLSYAQLAQQVTDKAAALSQVQLKPQDRLILWANKRIETVVALLAALAAGIVIVPLHPALRAPQLRAIFHRAEAHGLLVDATHAATLGFTHVPSSGLAFSTNPDEQPQALPNTRPHANGVANGEATGDRTAHRRFSADDRLAALLYTSGSTGLPKGVMVTRKNLAIGASAASRYLGLTAEDELLAVLPLSFDYGLSQLTTALTVGAGVTLQDYLLPNDLKKPLLDGGITVLAGTPGLLIPLAQQPWLIEAPNLRIITNSGGKLPVARVRALRKARPQTQLFLMYGLTEAFRASYLPPHEVDAYPDSIGRGFDGSLLGLVDEAGQLIPGDKPGEGELIQGGPLVTAGYFNDPEATKQRFRPPPPGWPAQEQEKNQRVVYSGDHVRRDADGRLYFLGRIDEQIKSQGFRVSPEEIERVALQHEGVTEALAFGYPIDEADTRIGLVVAPDTIDINALRQWLRPQLAPYQVPTTILALPALPRSNNDKLDRQASRVLLLDTLEHQPIQNDPDSGKLTS